MNANLRILPLLFPQASRKRPHRFDSWLQAKETGAVGDRFASWILESPWNPHVVTCAAQESQVFSFKLRSVLRHRSTARVCHNYFGGFQSWEIWIKNRGLGCPCILECWTCRSRDSCNEPECFMPCVTRTRISTMLVAPKDLFQCYETDETTWFPTSYR